MVKHASSSFLPIPGTVCTSDYIHRQQLYRPGALVLANKEPSQPTNLVVGRGRWELPTLARIHAKGPAAGCAVTGEWRMRVAQGCSQSLALLGMPTYLEHK